jgi:hypothetical protein
MRRRPLAHLPGRALLLIALVAFLALVAACGDAASSADPTSPPPPPAMTPAPTAPASTDPAPTKVPGGDGATPAPLPGTIDTSWGTAWEALPRGFPLPPGLSPAEPGDPADEPSSGAFVVERDVEAVAEQARAALNEAGYSIEALGGPAEDGSVVVDAVGQDPACRVRVTVRPLGGLTLVSVLFAAECPWD